MRYLIYIFITVFVLCGATSEGYAQFWKKKSNTASATSKGGSGGGKQRDAFAGKSKKGPNIYSSKPPKSKDRGKLYAHSISKKKLGKKRRQGGAFNSKKSRYKIPNIKSKGDGSSSPNSSSGGRKKGKGRKKE